MSGADDCERLHPTGGGLELRPYQSRIVRKALACFTGRGVDGQGQSLRETGSLMIESPTGSGKTVMGLAIADSLQRGLGMSVGWVAMRRNLLQQAQEESRRWNLCLDLRPISMFDRRPPQVDLLVVDEAQHDAVLSMANLHSLIKPRKVLGLTATPFRSDAFKLCFEKWIRDAGIHCLIQEGWLSRYRHYTLPRYSPEEVAQAYLHEPARWGKSLIFFHRLEECRRCLGLLLAGGTKAEVVTAKSDRERQIEDFASGRLQVLVNMLILGEGFDCPSLQTVFCRPSGRLCTIQMAGRVLRKHPGIDAKQVVQCAHTRHPFPRTAAPSEQYRWAQGRWLSLKVNEQIDAITRRMVILAAQAQVVLPQILSRRQRPPGRAWRPQRTIWSQGQPESLPYEEQHP